MSSNRREFLKGPVAAAAMGGLGSITDHGVAAESPDKGGLHPQLP
jgi:hypothetical protein